jgi:hypothetical protein
VKIVAPALKLYTMLPKAIGILFRNKTNSEKVIKTAFKEKI